MIANRLGCLAVLLVSTVNVVADSRPRSCASYDVEITEINYVYDDEGKLRHVQAIFWNWNPFDSSYRVQDWCFLRKEPEISLRENRLLAYDAQRKQFVRVTAKKVVMTYTQYDREMADQEFLPAYQRPNKIFHRPY